MIGTIETGAGRDDDAWKRRAWVTVAVLLAWFVVFTGSRLLNVPDEGRYAEVAREMVVTGDLVTPRLNGVPFLDKPPLFYWLEAASFSVFGVHPWSARLAPALLAWLGTVLVLLAGARLRGWRAGVLGAGVLATSPLWLGGGQYVNHDLAVAAFLTASLLSFLVGLTGPSRERAGWVVAGCAAAGLAVLTKGLIGIVFPFGITGLWVLLTGRLRRVPWLALAIGLLVLAALVAPWVALVQQANPDFLHYFFVTQHFERFAGRGFNNPMGPVFYPLLVLGGLLPWTAVLFPALLAAWRRWRADRSDEGGDLFLLLWPLVVVGFFSIPESKIAGYVLPAMPPLALLVGAWWDEVLARAPERAPRRALLASGILVGIASAALLVVPGLLDGEATLPRIAVAKLGFAGAVGLLVVAALARARRRDDVRLGLAALGAFAAVFGGAVLLGIGDVVHDDAAPFADALRPVLRDGDRVVAYRSWPYDLPLLLGSRSPLTVADDWNDPAIPRKDNWRRELWLGLGWRPAAREWMIAPEDVQAVCGGGVRCFVVVPHRFRAEFERLDLGLVPTVSTHEGVLLVPPDASPTRVTVETHQRQITP